MRTQVRLLVLCSLVLSAACGREDSMDDALRNDLSLASQPYRPMPYVSPAEMGYPGYGAYQPYGAPAMAQSQYYPMAPQPVSQTRTIRRAPAPVYSGNTGGARSTGTQVVKNTKRDAIIGAVGGAAIGAVTSRDKLKGAVLGGAIGAVLGGVIGNNVDIQKIPRFTR
jgi:hypothetical protein